MKNIFLLLAILTVMTSCQKDVKVCTGYTELTDQNHLVDINNLNGAQELIDTLTKYPQLQVYRIINDQYSWGMHCHVFYKGLKIFTENYTLFKNKSTNTLATLDSTIVDSINIALIPSIQYDKAISIARKNMNYKTCISYRLGIYDLNASTSFASKVYKLVWKIEGDESGYPQVVLDANNGQIYSKDDGIII